MISKKLIVQSCSIHIAVKTTPAFTCCFKFTFTNELAWSEAIDIKQKKYLSQVIYKETKYMQYSI